VGETEKLMQKYKKWLGSGEKITAKFTKPSFALALEGNSDAKFAKLLFSNTSLRALRILSVLCG